MRVLPALSAACPLLMLLSMPMLAQSTTCGNDTIFVNGYDPATFVSVTQLSGNVASPGISTSITGPTQFTVAVASPVSGFTTGESTVDVAGTFSGPTNTGIVLNGVMGASVNGQFLVPNVPLNAGSNTLNVVATKLTGATSSASTTVMKSGVASPVSVRVDQAIGYAPLKTSFTYAIGALPNNGQVQSVAIDFNGDNSHEFTGTSLTGAPTSYTYTQPGLYTAHVTVVDNNNATYDAYRKVLVQDFAMQRGMLCDVHNYLKTRLTAQDATGATLAYQSSAQARYSALFTALGSNMPLAAQKLGTIVKGFMGAGYAEFTLVRDNANQTRNGYPMRMTQGADGVWRIEEM